MSKGRYDERSAFALVLKNEPEQKAFCEDVKFSSKTMYQKQAAAKYDEVVRTKWHVNRENDWTQQFALKTRNFSHAIVLLELRSCRE